MLFHIFTHTTELRLAGGEAFLHPDIGEIIAEAEKYSAQFERLVIATNATYVPKKFVLETIQNTNCNIIINVDDYGRLSKKLNELLTEFINRGIKYVIHHYNDEEQYCGGWIDLGMDFTYKNYSSEMLARTFDICRKNLYVFDGKMYGCCPASAAYELGILQPNENDVVDLLGNLDETTIREKIDKLRTHLPYFVCQYCNGYDVLNGKRIKAAEQI
jgi:hypothetical protein